MWIGEDETHTHCSHWHDLLLKPSADYNFDANECHNHTCSSSEIKQQAERRYVHVRWLRSKTRTNVCRNKKFMLFLLSGGKRPLPTNKILHICLYLFCIPVHFSSTSPGVKERFQVSLVPMLEQRIAKHTQKIKKKNKSFHCVPSWVASVPQVIKRERAREKELHLHIAASWTRIIDPALTWLKVHVCIN